MINYDIQLKVAAVQFEPVWFNAHETVTKMIKMIEEASANGAKLIGFPECSVPGYFFNVWTEAPLVSHAKYDVLLTQNCLELGDSEMKRLMKAALDNNIYVVTGYVEREGGSKYMSNVIIDDSGKLILSRRKLKPTDAERIFCGEGSGDDLKVVETPIGILGTTNCFEHTQPLITYAMNSLHEQIHIASWPGCKNNLPAFIYNCYEASKSFTQVYAMQTQTYTIMSSIILGDKGFEFFGDHLDEYFIKGGGEAQIYSPFGDLLCEPLPDDQEGIVYADIDLNNIFTAKSYLDPAGQYSRPDVFCLNINKNPNPHTVVTNESKNMDKLDVINKAFAEEYEQ